MDGVVCPECSAFVHPPSSDWISGHLTASSGARSAHGGSGAEVIGPAGNSQEILTLVPLTPPAGGSATAR